MILIRNTPQEARIRVARDIDDEALPQLQMLLDRFDAESKRRLVVDLSDCDYMSSAGLSALILCDRKHRDNFEIWIRPEGTVHRIFDVTGLLNGDLPVHVLLGLEEELPRLDLD
jgi:anti-anti-sigma factor